MEKFGVPTKSSELISICIYNIKRQFRSTYDRYHIGRMLALLLLLHNYDDNIIKLHSNSIYGTQNVCILIGTYPKVVLKKASRFLIKASLGIYTLRLQSL